MSPVCPLPGSQPVCFSPRSAVEQLGTSRSGGAWKTAAGLLGRLSADCFDRWRILQLGEQRVTGRWTPEEEEKLRDLVTASLASRDEEGGASQLGMAQAVRSPLHGTAITPPFGPQAPWAERCGCPGCALVPQPCTLTLNPKPSAVYPNLQLPRRLRARPRSWR